jgi:hypothetical protein
VLVRWNIVFSGGGDPWKTVIKRAGGVVRISLSEVFAFLLTDCERLIHLLPWERSPIKNTICLCNLLIVYGLCVVHTRYFPICSLHSGLTAHSPYYIYYLTVGVQYIKLMKGLN